MSVLVNKSPNEVKQFSLDWSKDLGSDTILTSAWSASSTDLGFSNSEFITTATSIFIAGGAPGTQYVITNTVTTADGMTLENSFMLLVEQYNLI